MRKALAEVDRQYGGPVALAQTRFGLTEAGIRSMRSAYLV